MEVYKQRGHNTGPVAPGAQLETPAGGGGGGNVPLTLSASFNLKSRASMRMSIQEKGKAWAMGFKSLS